MFPPVKSRTNVMTMSTRQLRMAKRCNKRNAKRKEAVQQETPPTTETAVAVAVPVLRNPLEHCLNSALEQTPLKLMEADRPENTKKAHDGEHQEHFEFCNHCFGDDPHKCIVNSEKLCGFMWCTSFREKNPKSEKGGPKFDTVVCSTVMNGHKETGVANWELVKSPKKPLSADAFGQCKAVLKKPHRQQVAKRVNNSPWEMIWTSPFDEPQTHAKNRKPKAKKPNCEETVNGEFAPCAIVEKCGDIEQTMWEDTEAAVGIRSHCASSRHRCCALCATSAILCCDALHGAELSDFLGVWTPKKDTDIHQMHVVIQQIAFGETNEAGEMLHGRAARHEDPNLCSVGGTAFHSQNRFLATNEFLDFMVADWMNNSKWFDVKFLVDVSGASLEVQMKNDLCGTHIGNVLSEHNLACNKRFHLGRNMGAKTLGLPEDETPATKEMGGWDQTVHDKSHSAKPPLGPTGKMAGFVSDFKLHCNPGLSVIPTEELMTLCPIGKWSFDALKGVTDKCKSKKVKDCPTAVGFLRFANEMCKVFLQDSAAVMLLTPKRAEHPMFDEMAVFGMELFLVSSAMSDDGERQSH